MPGHVMAWHMVSAYFFPAGILQLGTPRHLPYFALIKFRADWLVNSNACFLISTRKVTFWRLWRPSVRLFILYFILSGEPNTASFEEWKYLSPGCWAGWNIVAQYIFRSCNLFVFKSSFKYVRPRSWKIVSDLDIGRAACWCAVVQEDSRLSSFLREPPWALPAQPCHESPASAPAGLRRTLGAACTA